MSSSPELTAGVRRPSQIVRDRSFGPFFVGRILATVGMWAHSITAAIVVYDFTGSALLVGVVGAAQFVPQFLITPWSGARSDRSDRRRQAVTGLAIAALGSAGLVASFVLGDPGGVPGAWIVIAGSFVVGAGYALASPPMQAMIPALVRPQELAQAVALNSLTVLIGRAAGPALGALAITQVSPTLGFALNGVTNGTLACILGVIVVRDVVQGRAPKDGSMRAAFRHLRLEPSMMGAMVGLMAVAIGSDPVLTLTPALATAIGEVSSAAGVMASAFGAGAFAAFLLLQRAMDRFGSARVGLAGLWLLAIGMGGLAMSPTLLVANAWLALGGAGLTFGLTALTTLVQERVPEELRGRMMAVWTIAWVGPRPLASTLSGAIADVTTVRVSIGVVAGVVVVGIAGARSVRRPPPAHG